MDRLFANIVSSNLTAAGLQLTGLASNVPVIYNASATNGQLQFFIGGFLSGCDLQVQKSLTLAAGGWQTVTNLSVGTNRPVFTASIATDCPALYFKVQAVAP
jgi:hypothetical protein